MTDNIIALDHIKKTYSGSEKPALPDFSLDVRRGEFFCLVGPSGCGKTTVLKLVAGLEIPERGKMLRPENTTMVFQSGALFPWMNVLDNASFGLRMKDIPDIQVKERTKVYLKMVGLEDFAGKYPRELSGGQRQRVGIARALALAPEVLLLDEPFSALDPVTTDELHADLLKIWGQTKTTVVMVSHSLEEAVTLADRVGVMKEGKLQGIVEIILPRPRTGQEKNFTTEVKRLKSLFS